jgi:hypothetical protein
MVETSSLVKNNQLDAAIVYFLVLRGTVLILNIALDTHFHHNLIPLIRTFRLKVAGKFADLLVDDMGLQEEKISTQTIGVESAWKFSNQQVHQYVQCLGAFLILFLAASLILMQFA